MTDLEGWIANTLVRRLAIDAPRLTSDSFAMALARDGTFCPDCGYDLRGSSSERCSECGSPVISALAGIIPWERRKRIGYVQAFVNTLETATFKPTQLARATGAPIDLRSARLFRWIVRTLVILPCVSLFVFILARNGGTNALITIDVPAQGVAQPYWEPRFLWSAGATLLPILPVGFVISVILATGISHWFFMKALDPARRNRAMTFSFYLCSPLGWILIPSLAIVGAMVLSDPQWSNPSVNSMGAICGLTAILSGLALLAAIVNSIRAINAATHCGFARALAVAMGIALQATVSGTIGLGLFPALVGLFRLMFTSLFR